jgi:hypothetical protein
LIVTQRPARVDTPRQAVVDITTGKTIGVGFLPESMTYDISQIPGSPWVVAPAVDDPGEWLIIDLRTMETRTLSSYSGATLPGTVAKLLIAADGANGSLLISPKHEQGAGNETSGTVWPGDALVLEGSLDTSHWIDFPADSPPVQDATFSPDGSHLALKAGVVEDHIQDDATLSIVKSADGSVISASETFENHGSSSGAEAVWVEEGRALLYMQGADLQRMPVDGGAITTMYSDPEPAIARLWDIRMTSDPNLILVGRDTAPGASEAEEDAMARWWVAVNLATGETKTYEGLDTGYMSWFPVDRYLVMVDFANWQDPEINYTVFDALTGEEIGRIENVPNGAGQGIGKNSVTSSRNGDVKVIAFDPEHIFLIREVDGVAAVEPVASPVALTGVGGTVTLNMSSDGSMLYLRAAHTRWMLSLEDDDAQWIEVPNSSGDDPGFIMFVNGTAENSSQ